MLRSVILVCSLALAPLAVGQTIPSSDPRAVSLAIKAVAALTGGNAVSDMTLNANVISILGSDYETGTAVLKAKGQAESRVDLMLPSGTRIDVRSLTNGVPSGAWSLNGAPAKAYAQHNCWTDSSWFVPAVGALGHSNASGVVFSYIGLEQHAGASVQHIQVFRFISSDIPTAQRLTTMDFYLDPNTYLPLAIGFNAHLDTDLNTDVPTETRFANYQSVNGVQVPFHIQRLLNGSLVLDVTVTSAAINTGIPDSIFTLP